MISVPDKQIQPESIPVELKETKNWLLWRYEERPGGQVTKVPYSPDGRMTGSQTAKWSFDEVCSVVNQFSGIGFAFTKENDFCGFDIDSEKDSHGKVISRVVDGDGNIIDPKIEELVKRIGSYTEISPSGEGIHVIFKGKPRDGWKLGTNKRNGELYFSGRYFTITGRKHRLSTDYVNEIDPAVLDELYYYLNPPKNGSNENHEPRSTVELDENDIIDRLMSDQKGRLLFLGNTSGYKSHSEADSALCCKIAFYTRDERTISNIFRRSGLYRKKWDREDYAHRTIENALDIVKETYEPPESGLIDIDVDSLNAPKKETDKKPEISVPPHLLTVPGVLGRVVEYYEKTTPKSQPQFAVQAALALGSVVLGRRWVTDMDNWPSLYFINVGKSSTGKEHAKTVINEILEAAGYGDRISTSRYGSGSGVYSELQEKPTHIAIIDEFGHYIDTSQSKTNTHRKDALHVLMQINSECNSYARIPALSRLGATKAHKDEMNRRKSIKHPAITILAMTTPTTFYNAINQENIVDGFIPRFIIVESEVGRQKTRRIRKCEVPGDLISWIYRCSNAHSGDGNVTDLDSPEIAPDPIVVPFTDEAYALFDEFEEEKLRMEDFLDNFGISEVVGKKVEHAMRLSLIIAVSCNSFEILPEHAKWAIDYIWYYSNQTVGKIRSRVSNSDFEAICKQVIEFIDSTGRSGATLREISRNCNLYRKSDGRVRANVIAVLSEDYDLVRIKNASHKGRGGAPTERYILLEHFNKDDWTGVVV